MAGDDDNDIDDDDLIFLFLLIWNTTMATDRTGKSAENYIGTTMTKCLSSSPQHRKGNKEIANIFSAHPKQMSSLCEYFFLMNGLSELEEQCVLLTLTTPL